MTRAKAMKEILSIINFLESISYADITKDLYLLEDNQRALALAWKNDFREKTKYIYICEYFIINIVERGLYLISYVPIDHMTANALIKALFRELHKKHMHAIGLYFNYYQVIKWYTCTTAYFSHNKLYAYMYVDRHFTEDTLDIIILSL